MKTEVIILKFHLLQNQKYFYYDSAVTFLMDNVFIYINRGYLVLVVRVRLDEPNP